MGILTPSILALIAGAPLLLFFAWRGRRRREVAIGSTLIWKRVAVRASASPRPRVRVDWLAGALATVMALGALSLAGPYIVKGEAAPDVAIWIDPSAAALLSTPDGRNALALDEAKRWGKVEGYTADPRRESAEDELRRWAASRTESQLVVVSPRRYAIHDKRIQWLTHGADPESLPFERLVVDHGWLSARVTRSSGEVLLGVIGGGALDTQAFNGRDLLMPLPPEARGHLELSLSGGRAGRDRAYLFYQSPVRVFIEGVSDVQRRALAEAFGTRLELVASADKADVCVVREGDSDGKPCLRIAGNDERVAIVQGSSLAWDSASAFVADFNPGLLAHRMSSLQALASPSSLDDVVFAAYDAAAGTAPILTRAHDGRSMTTSLDITGELAREPWVPVFLGAVIRELTGRNPLIDPAYVAQMTPSSGSAPLHITAAPSFASPKPGLYADGVINPVAPPPEEVWTEAKVPLLAEGSLVREVRREFGEVITYVALGLLLCAAFFVARRLEFRRTGTVKPA